MVKRLIILLLLISNIVVAQTFGKEDVKKLLKFSTFYAAVNGGTSLSDVDVFSVDNGLSTSTISTPYDYNFTIGLRKIARFGYENKAQTFYDGTESNYSDAATVGKVKGVEYLFEIDYKRQEGVDYMDQHHFIRFSSDEGCLALQEGYTVDVYSNEYYNPAGEIVATSPEVWEAVVIPTVLADYTEKKRNELKKIIQHSFVVGFDYYKYSKKTWLHAWGSLMPWHYNDGSEFSYHNYIEGDQWYDYSGGLIYGIKVNKQLGYFVEGKYNKYWNREWYDFKLGLNYTIF
jgi:hypothetical protein